MFVEVARTGVVVQDAYVFDEFDVRLLENWSDAELSDALVASGLGFIREGQAFIDARELERVCPSEDPDWRKGFEVMWRYAREHGWTGDDGRSILAHVKRVS
ncbi:hypothetical protein [Rhodococcus sp. 14-2483-1-2]|uniref:hypothetical protein n=1 Tax=Rhodococcus sp. 14-2483-1-2 TaxID=2023147 RepID=UPI000B9B240A|nr:hypothetical protein [Rhodococcus sp. 14-2483-1-2]OZF27242.1 hypothetical protein CH295_21845 [Rhodococcus sp. 14-2483-1-2]